MRVPADRDHRDRRIFASTAHRELTFASVEALLTFLDARRERWTLDQTPKWGLVDDVVERRRQDDEEWIAFLETDRGRQWSTKCDEREEAG